MEGEKLQNGALPTIQTRMLANVTQRGRTHRLSPQLYGRRSITLGSGVTRKNAFMSASCVLLLLACLPPMLSTFSSSEFSVGPLSCQDVFMLSAVVGFRSSRS